MSAASRRRCSAICAAQEPEILAAIRDKREIAADTEKALADFLDGFAKTFA